MRKLIESTLVSVDGVMGSPELWSPFDEESRRVAMDELGKDLIKYATSRVDDTLLRAGLVDEIRVLGHARRGRNRPAAFRRHRHLVRSAHPH